MSAKARSLLVMGAGAICGMALLAACFGAIYWLLMPQHFPLTRVELKGDFTNTSRAELDKALPRVSGNFFAADLSEVRASLERLPWVRHVEVRRLWPDRLEITIEEHRRQPHRVAGLVDALTSPRLEEKHRKRQREKKQKARGGAVGHAPWLRPEG